MRKLFSLFLCAAVLALSGCGYNTFQKFQQAQPEGSENRITVARNRYIQSVQAYTVNSATVARSALPLRVA